MSPFDDKPADGPPSAPSNNEVYIASVRPNDAVSPSDGQPLARVRYTNGLTYLDWAHVRHVDLLRDTQRPADYWRRIDRLAHKIVRHINTLAAAGAIPRVACFSELAHLMDPNEGWGDEIDCLPSEDWCAVQHRVTDILRTN